ncbi:hypothetical protein Tco_0748676, partial [Tanacetum coccineum]
CGRDGVEVAADGDDSGDVGGGDVVAGEGGYGVKGRQRRVAVGGECRRVAARGLVSRIDREAESVLGLGRKTHRKSFPAATVVAGGGAGFLGERREMMSFYQNKNEIKCITFLFIV